MSYARRFSRLAFDPGAAAIMMPGRATGEAAARDQTSSTARRSVAQLGYLSGGIAAGGSAAARVLLAGCGIARSARRIGRTCHGCRSCRAAVPTADGTVDTGAVARLVEVRPLVPVECGRLGELLLGTVEDQFIIVPSDAWIRLRSIALRHLLV